MRPRKSLLADSGSHREKERWKESGERKRTRSVGFCCTAAIFCKCVTGLLCFITNVSVFVKVKDSKRYILIY